MLAIHVLVLNKDGDLTLVLFKECNQSFSQFHGVVSTFQAWHPVPCATLTPTSRNARGQSRHPFVKFTIPMGTCRNDHEPNNEFNLILS